MNNNRGEICKVPHLILLSLSCLMSLLNYSCTCTVLYCTALDQIIPTDIYLTIWMLWLALGKDQIIKILQCHWKLLRAADRCIIQHNSVILSHFDGSHNWKNICVKVMFCFWFWPVQWHWSWSLLGWHGGMTCSNTTLDTINFVAFELSPGTTSMGAGERLSLSGSK